MLAEADINYFEHHIGDYDADTAHLTWVEDMAYTRLMRLYYRREKPIPVDINDACRLVRAASKDQRQAVADVLKEFFVLAEDGWHQGRCDAELARYMKKVEHNRAVGKLGGRPKKTETQQKPGGLSLGSETEPEHNPHHTPDTKHQSPDKEIHTPSLSATDGGRVCGLMRRAGLSDGNPGHPNLLALIAAGATDAEFIGAAQAAVGKGKGFAYAIGTLKRQRIDAASSAAVMHAGPMPTGPPDRKATQLQVAALMTGTSRPPQPREIIDVTPRVLIARSLG